MKSLYAGLALYLESKTKIRKNCKKVVDGKNT